MLIFTLFDLINPLEMDGDDDRLDIYAQWYVQFCTKSQSKRQRVLEALGIQVGR